MIVKACDRREEDLKRREENLEAGIQELAQKVKEVDAREKSLAGREAAVNNVRQQAAFRKAELETAKENVKTSDKARKQAEQELASQKRRNDRIQDELGVILNEKKALRDEVEKLKEELASREVAQKVVSGSVEAGLAAVKGQLDELVDKAAVAQVAEGASEGESGNQPK